MFTRLEEDYNGKEEHTRLVQEVDIVYVAAVTEGYQLGV